MKIYNEYKKIIENIAPVKKAYFTSFNISVEFIEKFILPSLMGMATPKNEIDYEKINEVLLKCAQDIRFFYDANMAKLQDVKKTTVKLTPIYMEKGVFHPKVVYLEGEKGICIIVGSGNLTLSGWAKNVEAFRNVRVEKNSSLYKQVNNFFADVFLLAGDTKNKPKKEKITYDNGIDFFYSYSFANVNRQNGKTDFLSQMHLDKKLRVWSPYFSDIDKLLNSEQFDKVKEIAIIPDTKDQKIRLKELPKDSRVTFFNEEEERFNHAKVWMSDSKIAIGSYNMTEQALSGKNFEAALIEEIPSINIFKITGKKFQPEIRNLIVEDYEEVDDIPQKERFSGLFKLTADWKIREIGLEIIICKEKKSALTIKLPGEIYKSIDDINSLDQVEREKLFSSLATNKVFSVYGKNNKTLFEGYIDETNTASRDIAKINRLEDIFVYDEKKERMQIVEQLAYLKNAISKEMTHLKAENRMSKNYFLLFQWYKKKSEELESIKKDSDLHFFCYQSPVSVSNVIRLIEEQKKKEKSVFVYLLIEEVNKLIIQVNKKMKKTVFKEIDNIKVGNNKEEKKFARSAFNVES